MLLATLLLVLPCSAMAAPNIELPPLPAPDALPSPPVFPPEVRAAVNAGFRKVRSENAAARSPALPAQLPPIPAGLPDPPRFSEEVRARIESSFAPLAMAATNFSSLTVEIPVRSQELPASDRSTEPSPTKDGAVVVSDSREDLTPGPDYKFSEDPLDPKSLVSLALEQQRKAAAAASEERSLFERVRERYSKMEFLFEKVNSR
jgi:hypothetical protein